MQVTIEYLDGDNGIDGDDTVIGTSRVEIPSQLLVKTCEKHMKGEFMSKEEKQKRAKWHKKVEKQLNENPGWNYILDDDGNLFQMGEDSSTSKESESTPKTNSSPTPQTATRN